MKFREGADMSRRSVPCDTNTLGRLREGRLQRRRGARWERMKAARFHLIRKETERGWEQNDDVSTLSPSLLLYGSDTGVADQHLRKRLLAIPLGFLEFETGLSRHTIVRARKGQSVHPRSIHLLTILGSEGSRNDKDCS